jgi:hypothetical protein
MEQYIRVDLFVHCDATISFDDSCPVYIKTSNENFKEKLLKIICNVIFNIDKYINKENKENNYSSSEKKIGACCVFENSISVNTVDELFEKFAEFLRKDERYMNYYTPRISDYDNHNQLFISIRDMKSCRRLNDDILLAQEYDEDKIIRYMMSKMINDIVNPLYLYPGDDEIDEIIQY